jgi:hypothetical protein
MIAQLTTMQKAFEVNMDPAIYGTIAEIGAGQEVARYFFLSGGAAGTIAKTISAYDMRFSDALYGKESSGRYVSENRLRKMLETEYELVVKRVSSQRPKNSVYFAFADTVTARSYVRPSAECHGWMGICLQAYPNAPLSEIVLHVRMLDEANREQQEAIGILGVNLIYAAFNFFRKPEKLIDSLRDNLGQDRIEIDVIRLEGTCFEGLDNRWVALHLIESDLTRAVLFSPQKDVVQPSEVLYKKNILVHRSHFCPLTNVTVDMIKCGMQSFLEDAALDEGKAEILPEISLADLQPGQHVNKEDILHRADTVSQLGLPLLVTTYLRFFRVREYLNRYTNGQVGFVLGIPNVQLIFDDAYYEGMEGGIMGAFAKLFDGKTKLFIYPMREGGEILAADTFPVPQHLKHLYLYLRQNRMIEAVEDFDESVLHIWPEEVHQKLKKGRGDWEQMVPQAVADEIIKHRMFDFDSER